MTKSAQTRIKQVIASQCVDSPCWIRSFHDVKATLDAMITDGELTTVQGTGTGRNMVGLTKKGAKRYKLTVEPHNLFDPPPQLEERASERQQQAARKRDKVEKRKKERQAEQAKQLDDLAEHMANEGSIKGAAAKFSISVNTVLRRWKKIKDNLGWQAI